MPKFALKKYVTADTLIEAISKDKETPVSDAWKEGDEKDGASAIGFELYTDYPMYSEILKPKKHAKKKARS
jgi:hypothetical protein